MPEDWCSVIAGAPQGARGTPFEYRRNRRTPQQDLVSALSDGGGTSVHLWPSKALALADGQTKALSLACRVAQDLAELRHAVAELLMADAVALPPAAVRSFTEGDEFLKIPGSAGEPLIFSRMGEPFTTAESARAHRLSEPAAVVTHPCAGHRAAS